MRFSAPPLSEIGCTILIKRRGGGAERKREGTEGGRGLEGVGRLECKRNRGNGRERETERERDRDRETET